MSRAYHHIATLEEVNKKRVEEGKLDPKLLEQLKQIPAVKKCRARRIRIFRTHKYVGASL